MTSRRLRPLRILLFDDRRAESEHIEKILWRAGGAPTRLATIDEAVTYLERHEVELALVRQDLARNRASVAALLLPEIRPALKVVFFGERPDPRLAATVGSGRALVVVDERTIAEWATATVPLLARIARDGRRVARQSREKGWVVPAEHRSRELPLPICLTDVTEALEESYIRAAVSRVLAQPHPSRRKAAKLLGLRESTMRTKMSKLGIPWPST